MQKHCKKKCKNIRLIQVNTFGIYSGPNTLVFKYIMIWWCTIVNLYPHTYNVPSFLFKSDYLSLGIVKKLKKVQVVRKKCMKIFIL